MGTFLVLFALVSASSALTTVTFHDDPNMGDKGTPWRVATCIKMTLNTVKFAAGAKLSSSDDGEACIAIYNLRGCRGTRLEQRGKVDIEKLRKAGSVSPCGAYEQDPEVTDEEQGSVLGKFTRRAKNDLVSVYADEGYASSDWFVKTIPRMAAYINKTYGRIGPSSNNRFLVFLQTDKQGYGTFQNSAYEDGEAFRNVARIQGGKLNNGKPGRPEGSAEFDSVMESIGCLLDYANNNVGSLWPNEVKENVWANCISFAHIFKYDMYSALGFKDEAARVKKQLMNYKQNVPKEGTYWFRDWLLPVYEKYGQAKVYAKFMRLVASNYPKKYRKVNGKYTGSEYARKMNLGEFVHFFSGAAGKNLKGMATKAFGWDSQREAQFQEARKKFSTVKYSN